MKEALSVVVLLTFACLPATAQEDSTAGDYLNASYRQQYDFISMKDTIYTFQSEFTVPDGYDWLNPAKMNNYQNWIANFPIWYRWKHVGIWKGNKAFVADEVSRVVHIPWKGRENKDFAIPMRIWAEYYLYRDIEKNFSIIPIRGETLTYPKFLESKVVRGPLRSVLFKPAEKRKPSEREFYKLLRVCMENSNYQSLASNCDSISGKELLPGDLVIGHNSNGMKGVVYMVMNVIENNNGDRMYCLATGCAEACDFHIPKFNESRENPWIDLRRIEELVTDFPKKGFFRKVIEK